MAQSGLPSALLGQVVHSIDFQPAVEAYRFEFSFQEPLSFRAGFAGPIGISVGQAPYMVRLTFAVPAAKAQFDFLARMAQQQSGGLGFTYDWWEGLPGLGTHWMITGCFLGDFTLTNDPQAGTSEKTISIMGQKLTKLQ
jgi:hypothetical protein